MALDSEFKKQIEKEDWTYFANLINTFELKISKTTEENQKLQKELQMTKKVIHAYLSHEEKREKFLSTKFFVKLYSTIKKLETKIEQNNSLHNEFLTFLNVLLYKMKKQKLVVYKVLEKINEFQKHKELEDVL